MTAKEFLESEYQKNKSLWSLSPVDAKWKKFITNTMDKYSRMNNERSVCKDNNYSLFKPSENVRRSTNFNESEE